MIDPLEGCRDTQFIIIVRVRYTFLLLHIPLIPRVFVLSVPGLGSSDRGLGWKDWCPIPLFSTHLTIHPPPPICPQVRLSGLVLYVLGTPSLQWDFGLPSGSYDHFDLS